MRRKITYSLLIVFAALLLTVPLVSIAQTRITQWTLLQKTSWVTIQSEQAIYQNPDSQHFYIHFRITNRTSRALAIDLNDNRGTWGIFYPFEFSLGQGVHRGPINGLVQIYLGDWASANKNTFMADFKAGKLTTIPPLQSVDFYSASPVSNKADINKRWSSVSFWQKMQTYFPVLLSNAQYLHVSARGMIHLTDGENIKSPLISGAHLAFPFPLHWKQIPPHAHIISNQEIH